MPDAFASLNTVFSSLFSTRLDVHVHGVEISQAIQYFHSRLHLTEPAQQGADNSVRLVANKPALVRVYLRAGLRSFGPAKATVEILRRGRFGPYHSVTMLTALPPGEMMAPIDPVYAAERGDQLQLPTPSIPGSLNFLVPVTQMHGSLQFRVTVSESRGGISGQGPSDTRDVYVDIDLRQTLRVRGIMVGYSGSKSSTDPAPLFLDPPSYPADLLTTARKTLLMFPVQSAADCSSAGWVNCTAPLDDGPGCSPNWAALVAKLAAQKTLDGNRPDVIYYGLLPIHVPFRYPHDGIGCERAGISVGRVAGGDVMAHQVGHECGLLHAPGVSHFPDPDPNYPAYPPYDPIGDPKGSMGEYGVGLGAFPWITLPRAKDIMGSPSFGGDIGLSLYHYGRLMENPKLDPVYIGGITATEASLSATHAQGPKPMPMLSIIGLMRSERHLEITSVMRLATRDASSSTVTSGLRAELRDEAGVPIAWARLRVLSVQSTTAGCCRNDGHAANCFPCVVQALLPDVGRGASMAVCDDERDVWSRASSKTPPRIERFDAHADEHRLIIQWQVKADVAAEASLQWSKDDGDSWNALASGLADDHATFERSSLPSGTVMLRLLVSDGFDTAVSEPVGVALSPRPPDVIILTPREDESIPVGGVLRLWGAATIDGSRASQVDSVRWMIDGKTVAEALDDFVEAPPCGEHVVELIVTAEGLEGRTRRRFVTEDGSAERKPDPSSERGRA
jgi:hypothetical protein